MSIAIHKQAVVGPDHTIQVQDVALTPGMPVEVIVVADETFHPPILFWDKVIGLRIDNLPEDYSTAYEADLAKP